MDEGPFRVPRSADRRSTHRQEPAPRPVEEPQEVKEEEPKIVKPVHHTTTVSRRFSEEKHHDTQASWKRFVAPLVALVVGIIIGAVAWFGLSHLHGSTAVPIESGKYQAVFFTNGQVYFGKLQTLNNGDYLKLTDIYYIQTPTTDSSQDSKNPQQTATNQNNMQLVKLGNEVHGPEDEMIIAKDQVLFYENLKPDGKVAQAIDKDKNK